MSDTNPEWQITVVRTHAGHYRLQLPDKPPLEYISYHQALHHLETLFRAQEMMHRRDPDSPQFEHARDRPRGPTGDCAPFDLAEAKAVAAADARRGSLWTWAQERFGGNGENWLEGFRAGIYKLALHDRGEGYMEGYHAGRSVGRAVSFID